MQVADFRATVKTFADPGTELLVDGRQVLLSFNGEIISAGVSTEAGDVIVEENGVKMPGSRWILSRLAHLPLLAARLRDTVAPTNFFVSPAANLLQTLDVGPEDQLQETDDALQSALDALENRSPLESTVLYITSDAGEGKTSLINELARKQARRFSEGESGWLLVPIPLGGRHFLRFDDITVGALQNRYRFPFLYYNSFLALVRMGVIVPAFDGFEEMFVESSSGEALSAMGILVGSLESSGALMIAARNAYFDFENLRTQERLFDTIRDYSVGFGKIQLKRWKKEQFLEYCNKRDIAQPALLYEKVGERLGIDHSLITRPVLVRRLIDVAEQTPSLEQFLDRIHQSGSDYFSVFVRSIIEREAMEKWIDRSGENQAGASLLNVDEHCALLSEVALAMWENRTDYLKRENLEFVADYFCETHSKNAFQAHQIRQRIAGHAILVPSSNAQNAVEFDHEEFKSFFLGEGIASLFKPHESRAKAAVLNVLRRGVLPRHAVHSTVRAAVRNKSLPCEAGVRFLLEVGAMDAQASYTQENCSAIIIRMLSGYKSEGIRVGSLAFGPEALRDRKLFGVSFVDCYFSATSLETTEIQLCSFQNCTFAQLRLFDSTQLEMSLTNCRVEAIVLDGRIREVWDPVEIVQVLEERGVSFPAEEIAGLEPGHVEEEEDLRLRDIERLARSFMRSTHLSDGMILMKLGQRGPSFIDDTLPELIRRDIIAEIENRGGEGKRRFRLGVSLQKLADALQRANGSMEAFLAIFAIAE